MIKDYKHHLEYIPLLLEQIGVNADRISKLVADAENGESLEAVKQEAERIAARNKTLLHLVATLIEEVKNYPPSPVRFY